MSTPVGWRWKLPSDTKWQFTDGPEKPRLGLPTSFEAAAIKEPVYTARSTAPEAGKAVVKPLEWRDGSRKCQRAQAALGFYEVEQQGERSFGLFVNYHAVKETFASLEAAKAAAQADYEQRIRSALASVPAPEQRGYDTEEKVLAQSATGTDDVAGADRGPQAVTAEDVAGLRNAIRDEVRRFEYSVIAEHLADTILKLPALARFLASEAEATSLRRRLEEAGKLTALSTSVEEMYRDGLERAARLGYDSYCTDCENVTRLHNGRCGCGSGRVIVAGRTALEDKP